MKEIFYRVRINWLNNHKTGTEITGVSEFGVNLIKKKWSKINGLFGFLRDPIFQFDLCEGRKIYLIRLKDIATIEAIKEKDEK